MASPLTWFLTWVAVSVAIVLLVSVSFPGESSPPPLLVYSGPAAGPHSPADPVPPTRHPQTPRPFRSIYDKSVAPTLSGYLLDRLRDGALNVSPSPFPPAPVGLDAPRFSVAEIRQLPGDNPILTIKSVNLTPDPPARGKDITVVVEGDFSERIEGGTIHFSVHLAKFLKLYENTLDLCDEVKEVDWQCPIEAGPKTLTKTASIPSAVPPGKYTIEVFMKRNDGREIGNIFIDFVMG